MQTSVTSVISPAQTNQYCPASSPVEHSDHRIRDHVVSVRVSDMSDAQMKAPGRLRRPSYFHAVAGGGGAGGGVSGRVLEALVAHQQQGKLAHSALGEVPVMILDPRYTILLLTTTDYSRL